MTSDKCQDVENNVFFSAGNVHILIKSFVYVGVYVFVLILVLKSTNTEKSSIGLAIQETYS